MKFHIRGDFRVEVCHFGHKCKFQRELHFDTIAEAEAKSRELKRMCNQNRSKVQYKSRAVDASVKRYDKVINRNAGMTHHYKQHRLARELQLIELLGKGKPEAAFAVNDGRGKLQIHEVWDTGVVFIYDFKNHKKITVFAPPPYRIKALYENSGEEPPKKLMAKSKDNYSKGYNKIQDA